MRKLVFGLLTVVLLAACGQSKQRLNVLIWPEYIDPKIVADFERQFDCRIILDKFDNDAAVIPKLAAGGASAYDIVCIGNHIVPALIKQNLLAPLRHENLPNFKNLSSEFTNLEFDPGNRFSLPYQWGTTGLLVRTPANGTLDESWGLVFDPAKQLGPFVLVDEMTSCLGTALRYKGYSVNTTNAAELADVRDLLINAKKRSLGFQVGTGTRQRVLTGDATVAMIWSGGIADIMKQNPGILFFIPREGAAWGIDSLAIPSRAPHRDLAEQFLNYLLDAKVAAQTAAFLGDPTVNRAALELLSPEIRNDPRIYPPPEVMRRLELSKGLGEMTKLWDEIWTQVKAK